MTTLLAHHIEMHHVPVLAFIFAAGCWIGWETVAKLQSWRHSRNTSVISAPDQL